MSDLEALVRRARRPVLVTGAGFSVASGLPTYRGSGGLWTDHPEREKRSKPPPAKMSDPAERRAWWNDLWELWGPIRGAVLANGPNAAHRAVAAWSRRVEALTVVTQNIDGLDRLAGTEDVVELHGSLFRTRCAKERRKHPSWPDAEPRTVAPDCPKCGRPARPDVVLFGEPVDMRRAYAAVEAADLVVVCGTSGSVYPANDLPTRAAQRATPLVRIDPASWLGPPTPWTLEVTGTAEQDLVAALCAL